MGITAIDNRKYGRLRAVAIPKVIESREEFDRMVERMEELDFKAQRSPEEQVLLALLDKLVKDYDDKIELPHIEPYQVVLHLMEQKGLRQADLLPIFGSRSVASAVLSGKRELSKAHIRGLAACFSLSPAAFF